MRSELDKLNRKQKKFVRRIAWNRLRAYDPAIIFVPIACVVFGAIIGVLLGVGVGAFLLFASRTIPGLVGAAFGGMVGILVSRPMIEQRRRYFYRDVITEHQKQLAGLG